MRFSIIIPVYNGEDVIKRCISSILNQSFKDFELLIIDDGSTDNTRKICELYKNEYGCIRYFAQSNKGPSVARNFALNQARGEYICFIDVDDYIESNYLKVLNEYIEEYATDVIFLGFLFEDGKTKEILSKVNLKKDMYNKNEFGSLVKKLVDNDIFGYTWCKIIKKSILNNIWFDTNYSLHEDTIFICEVLKKAKAVCICDQYLYHYTKAEGTLCTKYRDDIIENMEYVNKKIFSFYNEINIESIDVMILQRAVFSMYLILKNYTQKYSNKISLKEANSFMKGYTVSEIIKRKKIYKQLNFGKKKWIFYSVIILKSGWLFKFLIEILRLNNKGEYYK